MKKTKNWSSVFYNNCKVHVVQWMACQFIHEIQKLSPLLSGYYLDGWLLLEK